MIQAPPGKLLKRKENRSQAKWTLPPKGRLKLNFDGASKGNPGPSGAGFAVRDENGELLVAASLKLRDGTNNEAECAALYEGVKYCILKNWHNVDIEGDSLIVVGMVGSGQAPSWKLDKWAVEINSILRNVQNFRLSHVFREANRVADTLSKAGVEQVEERRISVSACIWPTLPELIQSDSQVS